MSDSAPQFALTAATMDGRWLKSPDHPTAWKELFMQRFGYDPDSQGIDDVTGQRMLTLGQ